MARRAAGELRFRPLAPWRPRIVWAAVDARRAAVGLARLKRLAVPAHHEGVAHGADQVVPEPDDLVILVTVIAEISSASSLRWLAMKNCPRFM